jgi:LysM repeat protein
VTVRQLRAWNALGAKGAIRAGQRLRVTRPPAAGVERTTRPSTTRISSSGARSAARVHTVRRGETLTGLAKRYGVSVRALRSANHMSASEGLRAGATLRIPG